ncbi:hypothetical protein XF36_14425 [Pseudonocardia sp. HH130629-09]|nr:hypothetical protein XF36_14425 [Pseudonocardia sp. HH130629-09]
MFASAAPVRESASIAGSSSIANVRAFSTRSAPTSSTWTSVVGVEATAHQVEFGGFGGHEPVEPWCDIRPAPRAGWVRP